MRPPTFVIASSIAASIACSGESDGTSDPALIHTVARSDLVMTVRERGELHAARDTRVSSELDGRNTLIYLIPEGTVVKEGDKLAELDASALEERRSTEGIAVARAKAALDQARKSFEVMEKELLAAIRTAESRLEIAEIRAEKLIGQQRSALNGARDQPSGTNAEMVGKLRQLVAAEPEGTGGELVAKVLSLLGEENLELQMGELANQILQQINAISLARANLELAADTLRHSEQLAAKGFITKNELDRDVIKHQTQLSEMSLAWNNLELLVNYTLPEARITARQEVDNARLGLASVGATNAARRVREGAELESWQSEFELAEERLANCVRQIEKAVLWAPAPGLVVYGRWDWDEPVFEGMEVRQRQEVIILPDVETMITQLKVHEAQIDKVASGQGARVQVDAFPQQSFPGRVTHVSTLPDPAPSYRNDVKVYSVTVELDKDNAGGELRPGMNATVEIDVGTLRDAVNVPLPAIERHGDQHFVWKVTPGGPVAAAVELGGNNLTHVKVVAGLSVGDRIHLVRPKGAELPTDGDEGAPSAPTGEELLTPIESAQGS